MSTAPIVPPTRVLAVASHVVSGYVGNKVAVFVLQSLGCDTAALNTVQFSNHTGYRHWTGTKATAEEITDLYRGLRDNYLDDFDMMLSGYVPGPEGVRAVGDIARELRRSIGQDDDGSEMTTTTTRKKKRPGDFFWVLDPVMGDNGRLYVSEEVVPVYKSILPYADLVIPNQFEAELLSQVQITDMASLAAAIQVLHEEHNVPHVVITSVSLPAAHERGDNKDEETTATATIPPDHLCVVGSTMTSTRRSRLFKAVFPRIDCYFVGTGDMFGALVTVRMREAVAADANDSDLMSRAGWLSDDSVAPVDLPLAHATQRVLDSMHQVLSRTRDAKQAIVESTLAGLPDGKDDDDGRRSNVVDKKAAELQLVRNLDCLRAPEEKVEMQPF